MGASWVLPGCFLLWHHQRVIEYKIPKSDSNETNRFFPSKRWVNLPSSPKAETSWALDSGDPKWCEWRFRLVVVCSKRTVWPHSIGFPREHCFFGLGPGEEKIQAFKKIYFFHRICLFICTRKEVRNFIHSTFGFDYRAVGRSENPELK